MRLKEIVDGTSNNVLYNKAIKRFREQKGEINCSICPYNKGENASSLNRNWKRFRKTQWRK